MDTESPFFLVLLHTIQVAPVIVYGDKTKVTSHIKVHRAMQRYLKYHSKGCLSTSAGCLLTVLAFALLGMPLFDRPYLLNGKSYKDVEREPFVQIFYDIFLI